MKACAFSIESISKEFSRRVIFEDLSFLLSQTQSLAITGRNGSGKSTLAKILCGLLSPTKGKVMFAIENKEVPALELHQHVGFVSPYINMYDEFSGIENLSVFGHIRNLRNASSGESEHLLRQFGIFERRNDDVRTYSSGMKQRLKYAAALIHHPEILILDEPTANLDEEGIASVRSVMRAQTESGILIIATNDAEDLAFAVKRIDLNDLNVRAGSSGSVVGRIAE
jgi:heme exporter protein A